MVFIATMGINIKEFMLGIIKKDYFRVRGIEDYNSFPSEAEKEHCTIDHTEVQRNMRTFLKLPRIL